MPGLPGLPWPHARSGPAARPARRLRPRFGRGRGGRTRLHPSAVSQQIAKLERETRTTLLERRGRGVALTEEARHLADTARELLAIVERAETTLEERRGQPSGLLTVAAFASAARGLLPAVLADLAARHPALDVRLTEVDPHLSVDLVARGSPTWRWRTTGTSPRCRPPRASSRPSSGTTLRAGGAAGHPFTARAVVRRADLGGQRWVCQPPGRVCHDWLTRTLRTAGFEPDIAHVAEENHTIVALVAAGLGVAVVPRLGTGALPPGAVAVRLEPGPVRRLYALWRTGAARRPAITETVRTLREHWVAAAPAPGAGT